MLLDELVELFRVGDVVMVVRLRGVEMVALPVWVVASSTLPSRTQYFVCCSRK